MSLDNLVADIYSKIDVLNDGKNIDIDDKTLELLLKLADETHLKDAINKQFNGDVINET